MGEFLGIMSSILNLFQTPMNVYGFSFSFWDVILYSCLISVLFRFIASFFNSGE